MGISNEDRDRLLSLVRDELTDEEAKALQVKIANDSAWATAYAAAKVEYLALEELHQQAWREQLGEWTVAAKKPTVENSQSLLSRFGWLLLLVLAVLVLLLKWIFDIQTSATNPTHESTDPPVIPSTTSPRTIPSDTLPIAPESPTNHSLPSPPVAETDHQPTVTTAPDPLALASDVGNAPLPGQLFEQHQTTILRNADETAESNVPAEYYLGVQALQNNKLDSAKFYFDQVVMDESNETGWLVLWNGVIAFRQGDYATARPLLEKIVAQPVSQVDYELAQWYLLHTLLVENTTEATEKSQLLLKKILQRPEHSFFEKAKTLETTLDSVNSN